MSCLKILMLIVTRAAQYHQSLITPHQSLRFYTNYIDKSTGIIHQYQTISDHIYIDSTMMKEIDSAVLYYEYDISDHLPTFANLQFSPSIKTLQRPEIRYISDNKNDSFLSELNCILNCPEVCESTNIMTLISIVTTLTETYFTKKRLPENSINY